MSVKFGREVEGLKDVSSIILLEQCIDRLLPILTHKRPVSTMRVPANMDDDDCFVLERLRELKRRAVENPVSAGQKNE